MKMGLRQANAGEQAMRQLTWCQFVDELRADCRKVQVRALDALMPEPRLFKAFRFPRSIAASAQALEGQLHAEDVLALVHDFETRAKVACSHDRQAVIDDWMRAVRDDAVPLSPRRRTRWAQTEVVDRG